MYAAYHLTALGTRDEIRRGAARAAPAEATFLRAVLQQYNGDVDGAVRLLRRLLLTLVGTDRAMVADVLAPLLVMRHENDEVMALADTIAESGWNASAHAFKALAYADAGTTDLAKRHATASYACLAEEADDIVRGRVLQRLSRAAYYMHEYEWALNLALASAKVNSEIGAWRIAAAGYSIAYSVHHTMTGDHAEAHQYARLWHQAASTSEDESFIQPARVAEFALAVQFGETERAESLGLEIKRKRLPEQYAERFPLALSYAFLQGANDLTEMRTLLQVLREYPGRSRGEWALCSALVAVAEAAEANVENAQREIYAALSHLGRMQQRDPAYEQQYRRLARVCVAIARLLLGDEAMAARTMEAKESLQGKGEESLPGLMQSDRLHEAPAAFRGVSRIFARAWSRRNALNPPAGLTSAEFAILSLLAKGWSAKKIARETNRSVNTVYNHTHAILEKLDASRAPEAVAIARERGLLE